MFDARIRSMLIALATAFGPPAAAQLPGAESDPAIVEGALREGKVVVYAATDTAAVQALLEEFRRRHPLVTVEYNDMNTTELYTRFLSEVGAGTPTADVLWSSAMDLQIKLANDGYAAEYASPASSKLPSWAIWKNEAYGTSFEPIGFAYDRRRLAPDQVPQSHAALARFLSAAPERWAGKVATYDPERSGIGFLLITQDAKTDPAFAEALQAYGAARVRLYPTTSDMLDRIQSGEHVLAFNVIGSYALARARCDPNVAFVIPKDYALVMSRIALIPKAAPHPDAARLFLDFILSVAGQEIIATRATLFAIRSGVQGDLTAAHLQAQAGEALRPITVGPSLLVYLDHAKRLEFLRQWHRALRPGRKQGSHPARAGDEGAETPR